MYLYTSKKRKAKKFSIIIFIITLLTIAAFKLFQIYAGIEINNPTQVEAEKMSETIIEEVNKEEDSIKMLETATKSVVGISKLKNNGTVVFKEDGIEQIGIGSGIIISENGYILTNEHVSGSKNSTCYVTMEDGKNYNANVIWSDSNLDLSIIKINMKCIDYAKLGNSDSVKVGQNVYAIGNPIGFEFQKTVTSRNNKCIK